MVSNWNIKGRSASIYGLPKLRLTSKEDKLNKAFIAERIIQDASTVFEDEPKALESVVEDSDIVLDTNVLLIPYGAGANSLSQISTIYKKIKDRNRLFLPTQVAREFVKNRPNKLADLHQGITDKISTISLPKKLSYPILESVPEFNELNDIIAKISELKSEATSTNQKVRNVIKNWEWNDPVSQSYRPLFTKDIVVDPQYEKKTLLDELFERYELGIPPGYKDAKKPDFGIGDYLIWKTILHIGEENKRCLIFVSGDEKADWQHGSGGSGFLPRYELQAEFRRISQGKDLYIIPLSRLLELEKAEESSVDEIRSEENRIRESTITEAECPECNAIDKYELGESIGSSALPTCTSCNSKFHLHRTRKGVIINHCNENSFSSKKKLEEVLCPHCESKNLKELGVNKNSTAWCICSECDKKFPIHRKFDGSVIVSIAPED